MYNEACNLIGQLTALVPERLDTNRHPESTAAYYRRQHNNSVSEMEMLLRQLRTALDRVQHYRRELRIS